MLTTETASPFDAFSNPAYEIQLIHVGASAITAESQTNIAALFAEVQNQLRQNRLEKSSK